MKLSIDKSFATGIRQAQRALTAVKTTVRQNIVGVVLTSKRNKLPSERGRQAHGTVIAVQMRRIGLDPFVMDSRTQSTVTHMLDMAIAILARAYRTGQQQTRLIRALLADVAEYSAQATRENIQRGVLGIHNWNRSQMRYFGYLRAIGRATAQYGWPPPRGIVSGRYVAGIRGGVRNIGWGQRS